MPRAKKTTELLNAGDGEPVLESGAGNLSPEDLAAIRGTGDADTPMGATLLSGTPPAPDTQVMGDFTTAAKQMSVDLPAASPEEVSLGARMATLEQHMTKLEKAMEAWAATLNGRMAEQPRHVDTVAYVRPATPAEEAAYCRENFERLGRKERQFSGIQEWRDANSPGLAA
jgi:hypothetical protein